MTTHATCWKVTRRDTTVEGYTDHDKDIVFSGTTYRSAVGFAPSAVDRNTGMDADNQQLIGVIDSNYLDKDDLRNGTYKGARVEIFRIDWNNIGGGVVRTLLVGHLGDVVINGEQYQAELLDLGNELSKPLLKIVSILCDADLGDNRCTKTQTPSTGSVTAVTVQRRKFTDTTRTEVDDYWNGGKLTWTSGPNNGRSMDVKDFINSSGTIELYEPMPDDITATETYSITRGCDKTLATCRDTFNNAANFRGFPYVPGVSDIMSGET